MLGDDVVSREVFCRCLQAQGCQQRNVIEAAWNSHVHGPILSLVGGVWSLLLARRERGGETWATPLFENITLGDVTKPSGHLKVISSLLLIMHWAQTESRPWLEGILTASRD